MNNELALTNDLVPYYHDPWRVFTPVVYMSLAIVFAIGAIALCVLLQLCTQRGTKSGESNVKNVGAPARQWVVVPKYQALPQQPVPPHEEGAAHSLASLV